MHATGTEKKLKIKKIVILLISALILVSITGIISYRIGYESKVKVTFTETEIPDKSRTVYVTPHGKKYHKESCDYVKGKGLSHSDLPESDRHHDERGKAARNPCAGGTIRHHDPRG